jgi:hypothetical protein
MPEVHAGTEAHILHTLIKPPLQRVDVHAVCPDCLHTICSKSCSLGEEHSEECRVLQGLQGGEGVSYQIVGGAQAFKGEGKRCGAVGEDR